VAAYIVQEYYSQNTWSLKYNIMFQYMVNVPVFPQSVIDAEIAYYVKQHLNPYGVPLDNRGYFFLMTSHAV